MMVPSNLPGQSRLNALINSNDVPSDHEASGVRYRIIDKQLRIEILDEKIEKTRAVLVELMRRREHEQRDLAVLKPIVSIIRRLPFEILGQIFIFSDQFSHADTHWNRPFLIFSQVCSRWRTVLHSTPTFWSFLSVTLTSAKLTATRGTQFLMKEWLSRAYPLPLDISLTSAGASGGDIIIEHVLLPFADRMRKLSLSLPLWQLQKLLDIPCSMPLIEVLHLDCPFGGMADWGRRAVSFEQSPRLHAVFLHTYDLLAMGLLILPWSQLTELYLGYQHPIDDMLRLLSQATNLRKCTFGIWYRSIPDTTQNPSTVVHHNLRHLSINTGIYQHANSITSPIASFFFLHLTLPALLSATITQCGAVELALFTDLQSRSRLSLKTLTLHVAENLRLSAEDDILRILDGGSSLVELSLRVKDDANRWLKALSYVPGNSCRHLIPRIEDLDLRLTTDDEFDGQAVVDMIQTRWWQGHDNIRWGVARLKKLHLHVQLPDRVVLLPTVKEQLQKFKREGLVLEITGFESDSST